MEVGQEGLWSNAVWEMLVKQSSTGLITPGVLSALDEWICIRTLYCCNGVCNTSWPRTPFGLQHLPATVSLQSALLVGEHFMRTQSSRFGGSIPGRTSQTFIYSTVTSGGPRLDCLIKCRIRPNANHVITTSTSAQSLCPWPPRASPKPMHFSIGVLC